MAVSTQCTVVGAKGTYLLVDNDDASAKMAKVANRWSISVAGTARVRKYSRLDIALIRFARIVRHSEKY